MTFSLSMNCDNAAFDGNDKGLEVSRILRETAQQVEDGYEGGKIFDSNGNSVGEWRFSK